MTENTIQHEAMIQRLLAGEAVTVRKSHAHLHAAVRPTQSWLKNEPFTIQRYLTKWGFKAYRITRNGHTMRGYSEIKYGEAELRGWVDGLEEVQP